MAQSGAYTGPLEQVGPCQWRIPKSYRADMRVDGLIFADDQLIEQIKKDQGPEQVANVATLPGIQKASLAMPDIHWGYGFCIGGVAATDPEKGGVISPGGVGYDINCGVRLLAHQPRLARRQGPDQAAGRPALPRHPHRRRPARALRVRQARADQADGSRGRRTWSSKGFGTDRDLAYTEADGRLDGADPGRVSDRAIARGADQCGTLGSGNHFLEVQVVDRVFDEAAAEVMGLREGQITRADPLRLARPGLPGLRRLPGGVQERSQEVRLRAARPAARLCPGAQPGRAGVPGRHARGGQLRLVQPPAPGCTRRARSSRESSASPGRSCGMDLVYDVAHNIAKFEEHDVGGAGTKKVCVHRKGATRAFPAGPSRDPGGLSPGSASR